MNTSAVADYIHLSKYARYDPRKKRRETYIETVRRVRDMHVRRYPRFGREISALFRDFVATKRVLPSMRSMQFGGKAIEERHPRQYNCTFALADRPRFLAEAFYLLLCGCGIGFSIQKQHVARIAPLGSIGASDVRTFVIPDDIEGWAEALNQLVFSYYEGYRIKFDYSLIRPRGAVLKTSGGRAPGPEPLRQALERIRAVLEQAQSRQLRPIEVYDILCHAAEAVLSGGIRRSAMIALFSPDDLEMMTAKTGNWWETHPWRARSNNSVVLLRDGVTKEQYDSVFQYTQEWGEPGVYFVSHKDYGVNPCVTGDTWVHTSEGPKQVRDLVGVPFHARVDGEAYPTTDKGFFSTGVQPVLRVRTKEGYTLRLTANHQVRIATRMTAKKRYEEWIPAGELEPGDKVILHRHGPEWSGTGSEDEGWLLGYLYGNGSLSNERAYMPFWEDAREMYPSAVHRTLAAVGGRSDLGSGDKGQADPLRFESRGLFELAKRYGMLRAAKKVTDLHEKTSSSFHRGFLRGWFDADGSVQGVQAKGVSVRLTCVDQEALQRAQRMLGRLGIVSTIYTERRSEGLRLLPDGEGGSRLYECQAVHELVIACDNLRRFQEQVGFDHPRKAGQLEEKLGSYKRAMNRERYVAEVVEVVPDGEEEVYDCTVPGPAAFDANGLYVHNCAEIGMNPVLKVAGQNTDRILRWARKTGQKVVNGCVTGWSTCNLTEMNAARFESRYDMYECARAAAILGTLQAGYTDFPYLGPITEAIVRRDALLGVSITGMVDRPELSFHPLYQMMAAQITVDTNLQWAARLEINSAARVNCIKPSGTGSLELGCIGAGIHDHHSRRYFRRIRASKLEPVYQYFRQHNPHMCEELSDTTDVITFCVAAPDGAITRDDSTAKEFLDRVLLTQKNWVLPGTAKPNLAPGLTHNVSNTVTVRDHEWEDARDFVWQHRGVLTGVSFLGEIGDKEYPHAPREAVRTAEDERRWNELCKDYVPVDYSQLFEEEDYTDLKGELACAGGACEI